MKFIAVLLAIIFVMPTLVFADSQDDDLEQNDISTADVFNVHVTPGAKYDGYIFRLVEDAIISFEDNENIQIIFAPGLLYRADTLQDIIDSVAPELIMYIEPNYSVSLGPMPPYEYAPLTFAPYAFADVDDPYYHDQWCLEFIRGAAAWSTISGPSPRGVVVAVLDSGIHRGHPDLNSLNILSGRNFIPDENPNNPLDDYGHGTAVAGVIAATRNNEFGVASMADGVTIMPLRVLSGNPLRGILMAL